MPRGDGTGPRRMGLGTGRANGFCSSADVPGFADFKRFGGLRSWLGRFGLGRGRGRGGLCIGFDRAGNAASSGASYTIEAQRLSLQRQAQDLEASLETIEAQLAGLDNKRFGSDGVQS